jgi:hypothetical protein
MAVALPMPEPAPVTMAILEFCVMAFSPADIEMNELN